MAAPKKVKSAVVAVKERTAKSVPLRVKAIFLGFYGFPLASRKKPGEVFTLKKKSDFSHLWMEALNFEPEAPAKHVEKMVESHEYKARLAEYRPFDKRTHPTAQIEDEVSPDCEGDEYVEEEAEELVEGKEEVPSVEKTNEDVL